MERAKKGEAISPAGRTTTAKKKLRRFADAAKQRGDFESWRRGKAVLGYTDGRRVIELAAELDVTGSDQPLATVVRGRWSRGAGDGQSSRARRRGWPNFSGTCSAHSSRSARRRAATPAACGLARSSRTSSNNASAFATTTITSRAC